MNNIIDYMKFRNDIPFKYAPFNDADALMLATIVALEFTGSVDADRFTPVNEVIQRYDQIGIRDELDDRTADKEELLHLMKNSKRYEKIAFTDFVKDINIEQEKTFYGLTYKTGFNEYYVVFRGTDGSVFSWKENFNTLYSMPTVGQSEAVEYLKKQMDKHPFGKFYVGGHSKGANLAVYASMFVGEKYQNRIKKIYSFDGPGYMKDISVMPQFQAVKNRILSVIPVGSVIGRLMEPPYKHTVVDAGGKGVYQHDVFYWSINTEGFNTVEHTDEFSESLSGRINDWIESIPVDKRKGVVDELFDVFINNNINHIYALVHMDIITILGMIRSAVHLSNENKAFLVIILRELLEK